MAYQPEWQNRRTPAPDQATRDRMRAGLDQRIAQSRAAGYGPADFSDLLRPLNKEASKLSKSINANMKASEAKKPPTWGDVKKAAKAHRTLVANVDSSAFDSVTWKDGIVTAVFWNDYTYSAPLDLNTFRDWTSESLGRFYNHVLGRDFFA